MNLARRTDSRKPSTRGRVTGNTLLFVFSIYMLMRLLRLIIKKLLDVWNWLFYLFSAFTLILVGIIILVCVTGWMNIHGVIQNIIIWIYIVFVGVYTSVKCALWCLKVIRRILSAFDKTTIK